MTTTYIGFQRVPPDSPVRTSLLDSGTVPVELTQKVMAFPSKLPSWCQLVGSWAVPGDSPQVVIVTAESVVDLQNINNYYAGWVVFDWHPCKPGARIP